MTVGKGSVCPNGTHVLGYFQPTFLYESLWDIALAVLLLYLDRRYRMGHGTLIFAYGMAYTLGRGWIEALRSDHANHILGLRLNDWTSIIVFLVALDPGSCAAAGCTPAERRPRTRRHARSVRQRCADDVARAHRR